MDLRVLIIGTVVSRSMHHTRWKHTAIITDKGMRSSVSIYTKAISILCLHCSVSMTEAKALATLGTSTQNLNALLPERVCRPRPHLELASD